MIGDVFNGLMGAPSAPQAPDYAAAAREQGQSNLDAAIATGIMNRPNQTNPWGSNTWTQHGTTNVGGREVPNFTNSTSFTPAGQALFDSYQRQQGGMSKLADTSMGQVQNAISSPFDPAHNRDAIVNSYMQRQTRMLDPRFAQGEDALRSDLANRGFSVGDKGYTTSMDNFQRQKDEAYQTAGNYANTEGAKQAITENLIARNQPMQEFNALRTGAMPQSPQFSQQTQAGSVAGAPMFAGAQAQGNAALTNFGIRSGTYNNMISGLSEIGAAAAKPFG